MEGYSISFSRCPNPRVFVSLGTMHAKRGNLSFYLTVWLLNERAQLVEMQVRLV